MEKIEPTRRGAVNSIVEKSDSAEAAKAVNNEVNYICHVLEKMRNTQKDMHADMKDIKTKETHKVVYPETIPVQQVYTAQDYRPYYEPQHYRSRADQFYNNGYRSRNSSSDSGTYYHDIVDTEFPATVDP